MRIGIDARPLQGETQFRGIGKALESVLINLAKVADSKHEFTFYIDADLPKPSILKLFTNLHLVTVPSTKLGRKRYFRSFLASYRPVQPDPKTIDVFLQYDASLGVPTVVPCVSIFHDLIPLLFRDEERKQPASGVRKYKNKLAGNLYWQKYLQQLDQYKRSRKIIAISESSKKDYKEHLDKPKASDISVVHLGLIELPILNASHTSPLTKQLGAKPFLLYVGGIDFRKNVVALLQTFYALKADFPELCLVVAGKEFGLQDQLSDRGWSQLLHTNETYAQDVIVPGFVADADLAWLYAHAAAFVFPSRYEGFGLPVLEAMQAGCPVIAYNNSSIPEVAGEAALLVEDGGSMVEPLTNLLQNPALRRDLVAKGKKQAAKFSWKTTAEQTLKVLQQAAEQED